ncbi:MAG TPA: alpha/beta hydrolase [Pseudolabrys sp.]|nr:alpha/beta hydrolase [Pseudolabrys sp.]
MRYVYGDMDQQALDFHYNNQAQVADPRRYLDWYIQASEAVRARVEHVGGVRYGPLPDERLDVFRPAEANDGKLRPVVIFVHGGAWQHLDLARSSFAAETFTARGALYVPVGFTRMPAAGSLDEMVAQVRTAIAWVWQHIEDFGGDRNRLHLMGHSSGGHLAGMGLVTDWPKLFGLPADMIRSAVLLSGIYDLEPVRLSYRNQMLKLDRAAELRNSPCRNLPAAGPPVLIAHGELETPEFKQQARLFAEMWQRRFGNCRLMEVPGVNHYEAAETLTELDSMLTQSAFEWFGL